MGICSNIQLIAIIFLKSKAKAERIIAPKLLGSCKFSKTTVFFDKSKGVFLIFAIAKIFAPLSVLLKPFASISVISKTLFSKPFNLSLYFLIVEVETKIVLISSLFKESKTIFSVSKKHSPNKL